MSIFLLPMQLRLHVLALYKSETDMVSKLRLFQPPALANRP